MSEIPRYAKPNTALLTSGFPPLFLLKITIRPPLSPVARCSPESSKCTADSVSAAKMADRGSCEELNLVVVDLLISLYQGWTTSSVITRFTRNVHVHLSPCVTCSLDEQSPKHWRSFSPGKLFLSPLASVDTTVAAGDIVACSSSEIFGIKRRAARDSTPPPSRTGIIKCAHGR